MIYKVPVYKESGCVKQWALSHNTELKLEILKCIFSVAYYTLIMSSEAVTHTITHLE